MKNLFIGNEQLQVDGHGIAVTIDDFWRWAGSDLTDEATRSVFAEFLVASSLEILERGRQTGMDYDLLWPQRNGTGVRVNVRSAAYVQSEDAECPDHVSFSIEGRDRCDVYVFCLYKAMQPEQSPLDTGLWDFYTLRSRVWGDVRQDQKTSTLHSIMGLGPVWSDYYGIGEAIKKAMAAR